MPVDAKFLDGVQLFADFTPEERREIGDLAVEQIWETDTDIFREGEPGESLFLVTQGAVELTTEVGEGVERPLITVRPGSAFGLVEIIDQQPRAVTARAAEPTTTLEITRSSLAAFIDADPASRCEIIYALSAGLARQSRVAMDLLRQNLAWTLEVSGAVQLNLNRLMAERVRIEVELVNGTQVSGTLLKVEPSAAGHEVLVKAEDDRVHLIPYHAIVRVSFGAGDVPPEDDTLSEL